MNVIFYQLWICEHEWKFLQIINVRHFDDFLSFYDGSLQCCLNRLHIFRWYNNIFQIIHVFFHGLVIICVFIVFQYQWNRCGFFFWALRVLDLFTKPATVFCVVNKILKKDHIKIGNKNWQTKHTSFNEGKIEASIFAAFALWVCLIVLNFAVRNSNVKLMIFLLSFSVMLPFKAIPDKIGPAPRCCKKLSSSYK